MTGIPTAFIPPYMGAPARLIVSPYGGFVPQEPFTAWQPTIASRETLWSTPDDSDYCHVPAVAWYGGKLWVFAIGNLTTAAESHPTGQRVYLRTGLPGAWDAEWVEPFASATLTTNPIASPGILNEVRCAVVGSELWVFYAERGSNQALIWARLSSPTGQWTLRRLLRTTATGALSWSATNLTGSPGAGLALTLLIGGKAHTILPNDLIIAHDGRIVLLLNALEGSFQAAPHTFVCLTSADNGATWGQGNALPRGPYNFRCPIEGSLVPLRGGEYVLTCRISTADSNIAGEAVAQAITDLVSFSPLTPAQINIVSSRIAPLRGMPDGRYGWTGCAAYTERVHMSVGFSRSADEWELGPIVSDENWITERVHYSAGLVAGSTVYVAYTEGIDGAAPTRLKLVSFAAPPPELLATTSKRGAATLGQPVATATAVSSIAGTDLTIGPRGTARLETVGDRYALHLSWRITEAPSPPDTVAAPYTLAVIGNADSAVVVTLRNGVGGADLYVDSRPVRSIATPTAAQTLTVLVDRTTGRVVVDGISRFVSGALQVMLGDAYLFGSASVAASIVFDVSRCTLQPLAQLPTLPAAVLQQTGENVLVNPGLRLDQRNRGAAYNYSTAPPAKLDGLNLTANGGQSGSIQQAAFSANAAAATFGGWQHSVIVNRSAAGSNPAKIGWELEGLTPLSQLDCSFCVDLEDTSDPPLEYDVEVYIAQFYDPSLIETRVGVVQVDGQRRRFHVPFRLPSITSGTSVGAQPRTAVQLWLPGDVDYTLRLSRADLYTGAAQRLWSPPDQTVDLVRAQRYLYVIETPNLAALAVTAATVASNVLTVTTASSHGLTAGMTVVHAGFSPGALNGTFSVASVPSSRTYTVAVTSPNGAAGTLGTYAVTSPVPVAGMGQVSSTSPIEVRVPVRWPQAMARAPVLTVAGSWEFATAGGVLALSSVALVDATPLGGVLLGAAGAGSPTLYAGGVLRGASATARLLISAERQA
jgi:hypothetical protein